MFYFSKKNILEEGKFQGGKCGFVEIPQEYSVEIDSPFDLAFAEQVLSKEYIQLFMWYLQFYNHNIIWLLFCAIKNKTLQIQGLLKFHKVLWWV